MSESSLYLFMRVKEYGKLAQNTTIVKIKKMIGTLLMIKVFFYHYISQSLKIWSLNVISYNMLIPIQICTAYQATEHWRPVQSRFEVRGGTDNCSEHGEHQTWFVLFFLTYADYLIFFRAYVDYLLITKCIFFFYHSRISTFNYTT